MEIVKYTDLEYEKWLDFKAKCRCRLHGVWIVNTCKINQHPCEIENCFAHQLTVFIKGFF